MTVEYDLPFKEWTMLSHLRKVVGSRKMFGVTKISHVLRSRNSKYESLTITTFKRRGRLFLV